MTGAIGENGALTLNANITIGAFTLTFGTGSTVPAGSGTFTGSSSSIMIINGTGALGTLNFTSGSQTLNNLTINRSTSGTATLGTPLSIAGVLTLTNGIINEGSNLITITGTAQQQFRIFS